MMLSINTFTLKKFRDNALDINSFSVISEVGKSKKSRVVLVKAPDNTEYALKITSEQDLEKDICHRAARESHLAAAFAANPAPHVPRYYACFWHPPTPLPGARSPPVRGNDVLPRDDAARRSDADGDATLSQTEPSRDSFRECKEIKILMDFCPGRTLFQIVRERKGLPESSVQSIVAQVAETLAHLHERGYIYVDLKSENVIFHEPTGRIHLVDFDLCHTIAEVDELRAQAALDSESTKSGSEDGRGEGKESLAYNMFWGTDEYVAPEVIRQGCLGYSPLSDWWSLGVLTVELLRGRGPFAAPTRGRTFDIILNRSPEVPDNISHTCRDFIRSLLRHQTRYRLGSSGSQDVLRHPFCRAAPKE